MRAVYVVGTLDTTREELAYVRDVVEATGLVAVLVDVGTTEHQSSADVKVAEVAGHHPDGAAAVVSSDRGIAVSAMAVAFEAFVRANDSSIGGIIGIGGSGGTAIITPGMRALPVGRPKMMVSTVASGNVGPYVGPADIAMMYSVTDVDPIEEPSQAGAAIRRLKSSARWRSAARQSPVKAGPCMRARVSMSRAASRRMVAPLDGCSDRDPGASSSA